MASRIKCPKCLRSTAASVRNLCLYCGAELPRSDAFEEPRKLGEGAAPRFRPQADDRVHWLLPEIGEPIQVPPGLLFVMGRDPHASLVIGAADVSRQHAELQWEGSPPRPLLAEVRSTEGTFLNDARVEAGAPRPVRSGDRIRLGPRFTLVYQHVTEREMDKALRERGSEETRKFTLPGRPTAALRAAPPPVASGVPAWGDLEEVPAAKLLQRHHEERSDGLLSFFDGDMTGEMLLEGGKCTEARCGSLSGREVLEHFVRLQRGAFFFRPGPAPLPVGPTGLLPIPAEGRLEEVDGQRLIDTLEDCGALGLLTVFGEEGVGQASFEGGVLREVSFEGSSGKQGVALIRRLRRGAYRFRGSGGITPARIEAAARPTVPLRKPRDAAIGPGPEPATIRLAPRPSPLRMPPARPSRGRDRPGR